MKKRNIKKTLLIVLAVIAALIVVVLGGIALYVDYLIELLVTPQDTQPQSTQSMSSSFSSGSSAPTGSIGSIPTDPETSTGPEETVTTEPTEKPIELNCPVPVIETNNINVMLLGQDASDGVTRTRTDTMILMSINKTDGTISLTSFMRDLYVYIPGWDGCHKLNSAYPFGGYEMFKDTMEYNFGVLIDFIVHVKFEDFAKIVDILGGVDIDLTQAEATYLNDYYYEKTGVQWTLTAGRNHLTGMQTFHYSRIRKIDSDYSRTERQRKVLTAIFDTYKSKPMLELLGITAKIMPLITTYDLEKSEVYNYIRELLPIVSGCTIQSHRVPFDDAYSTTYQGMYVLVCNMLYTRGKLAAIIGS